MISFFLPKEHLCFMKKSTLTESKGEDEKIGCEISGCELHKQ